MKKSYLLCLWTIVVLPAIAQQGPVVRDRQAVSPADSLFRLGYHYYRRNPVAPGLPGAVNCFLAAAAKGQPQAMEMMGELYDDSSLLRNGDSAVYWFERGARAGSGRAWFKLGWIYETARHNRAQDFYQAADCFYKGMLAGDKGCKEKVAYFLYKGFVGRQDYDSACLLYRQLAWSPGSAYSKAMYFLGLCYRNGYGTPRNADSAGYWLHKAAKANECQAQLELAMAGPDNPVNGLQPPGGAKPSSVAQSFRKVGRQLAAGNLEGIYNGYVMRYDWSGQHLTSIFPLQTTWNKAENSITGSWKEGGSTLSFEATATDSGLVFNNTQYEKKLHYTKGMSEPWEFRQGDLQWMVQGDSVFLTGRIRIYSPARREPGVPLYIHLARVATALDKEGSSNAQEWTVTATPNPFHDRVTLHFVLNNSQHVNIVLMTLQGQILSTEDAGTLQPGNYTHQVSFPSSAAAGAYLVSVNGDNSGKRTIVVKQ